VPIAEFVLGAMLVFEKRYQDVWLAEPPPHWNFAPLGGLAGKTVGIVGFGGIGQAIARRALAFEATVLATRRTDRPSEVSGATLVASLDELLTVSDHLVLAVPLTPRTENLLGADAFEKVKPGLHLVNIARGGLVDQDALRSALDDGRVAIATLDTVTPEPLPAGHWLYEHPQVRLSAHVSWFSPSGLRLPVEMFVENLGRYMRGESLRWIVDRDEGY
jgi:phosphoglycerate dehydrogenase-like enzyme